MSSFSSSFVFVFMSVSIDSSSSAVGMWETRRVFHISTALSFTLAVFFSLLQVTSVARDDRVRVCNAFSMLSVEALRVPYSKVLSQAAQSP